MSGLSNKRLSIGGAVRARLTGYFFPTHLGKTSAEEGEEENAKEVNYLFDNFDQRISKKKNIDALFDYKNYSSILPIIKNVIVFSRLCEGVSEFRHQLEIELELNVVMVNDPNVFYEWLFRGAHIADLVVFNKDSFLDEYPCFETFMRAANSVCDEVPIVVTSKKFMLNNLSARGQNNWDISLALPVSTYTIKLALQKATDIARDGKSIESP
ncbi:hypothetical protein [Roseovarius sp. MBR-78]|uniref:hypothetical protein n=1 Tax=Roseovarius sp. MBR-78 TaxID=3156460 RepID=UPI003393F701